MNKLIFIAVFLALINLSFALPNPAAVYCQSMGYTYNIIKTPQGDAGQCMFPDNTKCDEWDFFKGKCGATFSYCVKNGYNIKTVSDGNNSYSPEYAVCVPKKKGQVQISVTDILKNTMNITENLTVPAFENKTISSSGNLVPNTGGGGININTVTSTVKIPTTGEEMFTSETGIETCSDAFEGQPITLACRSGYVITRVWYTKYITNNSSTTCEYPFPDDFESGHLIWLLGFDKSCTYNYGSNCIGKNSCSFTASNTNCGGDPAPGESKRLIAFYECDSTTRPSLFDWRNVNSSNWMTPVKDQGKCGSCWAFADVAAVEAQKKIEYNTPTTNPDLSEQDLVSCAGSYVGTCNGGYPFDALDYIETSGLVDEACFPYMGCKNYTYDSATHYYNCNEEYACNLCSDWKTRLQKVGGYDPSPLPYWVNFSDRGYWAQLMFPRNVEKYITEKGPVLIELDMSSGHFVNGVYTGCVDSPGPNHAVVLVGYNRTGDYWIAKNSWGSTWNGNGYFKLDSNAIVDCKIYALFNVYAKPDTCIDSNPYANLTGWDVTRVKSNVSGILHEVPYFYSDYCINSTTVVEYRCNWYSYLFYPGKLTISADTYDCTYHWGQNYYCSDGACREGPAAALKGGPNGQLYIPFIPDVNTWDPNTSPPSHYNGVNRLKIEMWCNLPDTDCQTNGGITKCGCNRTWGDNNGGKSPYLNLKEWPDGKIDGRDVALPSLHFGAWEGCTASSSCPNGWDYMADVTVDKKIDGQDNAHAALNFGYSISSYSTDLSSIKVTFDTGDTLSPDANGYVLIPSFYREVLAHSFTVYSGSKPVEALVTFWNSSLTGSLAAATTAQPIVVMMEPTQEMPVGNSWTVAVIILAILGLTIGYFIMKDILVVSAPRKRKRK